MVGYNCTLSLSNINYDNNNGSLTPENCPTVFRVALFLKLTWRMLINTRTRRRYSVACAPGANNISRIAMCFMLLLGDCLATIHTIKTTISLSCADNQDGNVRNWYVLCTCPTHRARTNSTERVYVCERNFRIRSNYALHTVSAAYTCKVKTKITSEKKRLEKF